jgi:LPS export ABC transporter protein LptC
MHKGWLLIIIPCAMLLFLIDQPITRNPAIEDPALEPLTFDSWSTNINTTLFGNDGQVEYTMQATRQVHYLDNTADLENPYLQLHRMEGQRWNITADSGRILSFAGDQSRPDSAGDIQRIDLINNVQVVQADPEGSGMTLTTSFLSLYPETETLGTDQPVRVRSRTIDLTAVGMHADLNGDTVTFLSEIRGKL